MRYFALAVVLLILTQFNLHSQPHPDRSSGDVVFTDDGIRHKNMELICPINFPGYNQNNEMVEFTRIDGDFYYVGSFNPPGETSYIRLDKLTDPRLPDIEFRKVYYPNTKVR
jgi:hypothetical protein